MRKLPLLAVLTLAATISSQIPLSPYSSTYTGSTRGYYFQAPSNLTITGARVPDEMNHGLQTVEILKLPSAPPQYPATVLGTQVLYVTAVPSKDVIPCSIPILSGEFVCVLGMCGNTTVQRVSYGAGNVASNVLGQPITLLRLLTQNNIANGGNKPLSAEGTASIGRVELYVAGHNAAINYGTGTAAGAGAIPSLTAGTRPILGTTCTLNLNQTYTGTPVGAIVLAIGRANIPLLGGTVLVNPPVFVTFTLPVPLLVGDNPLGIPIPNNPVLSTSPPLDLQGFVVTNGLLAMTNGTELWLGL